MYTTDRYLGISKSLGKPNKKPAEYYKALADRGIAKRGPKPIIVEPEKCYCIECIECGCNSCKYGLSVRGLEYYGYDCRKLIPHVRQLKHLVTSRTNQN